MSEVNKTKERIKSQRNIILEELARTDDKKYATQSILESIFNKDEAVKILKDIRVDGKTDQQIADQITRHIDRSTILRNKLLFCVFEINAFASNSSSSSNASKSIMLSCVKSPLITLLVFSIDCAIDLPNGLLP